MRAFCAHTFTCVPHTVATHGNIRIQLPQAAFAFVLVRGYAAIGDINKSFQSKQMSRNWAESRCISCFCGKPRRCNSICQNTVKPKPLKVTHTHSFRSAFLLFFSSFDTWSQTMDNQQQQRQKNAKQSNISFKRNVYFYSFFSSMEFLNKSQIKYRLFKCWRR